MKLPGFVNNMFGVLDEDVRFARSTYRPVNGVETKVYNKVAECGLRIKDPNKLWPFYKLRRDLGYSDHTISDELMFGLEDEFNLIIHQMDAEKWETVEDVYFYVRDEIIASGKEAAQKAGLIPADSNTETFDLRDKH